MAWGDKESTNSSALVKILIPVVLLCLTLAGIVWRTSSIATQSALMDVSHGQTLGKHEVRIKQTEDAVQLIREFAAEQRVMNRNIERFIEEERASHRNERRAPGD